MLNLNKEMFGIDIKFLDVVFLVFIGLILIFQVLFFVFIRQIKCGNNSSQPSRSAKPSQLRPNRNISPLHDPSQAENSFSYVPKLPTNVYNHTSSYVLPEVENSQEQS